MRIRIARVYDPEAARPRSGEARVLVDRVWPRGKARDALELDVWLRDVAPSDALRKWFGHDPERFEEFRERYRDELTQAESWVELLELTRRGNVVLLYGARDEQHNQAVVLREFLLEQL